MEVPKEWDEENHMDQELKAAMLAAEEPSHADSSVQGSTMRV